MEHTFTLHILAADRRFFEGECASLIIPTLSGQYGIMAHHRNMISALVPGTLVYTAPQETAQIVSVSSGLIKVEDNDVLILVDSAERPEEIDLNRAMQEAAQAQEELLQKKSIYEYKTAQAKLARAIGRMKIRRGYDINHPTK